MARTMTATACSSGQEIVQPCDLLVTTATHTGGAGPFGGASDMKAGSFAAVVDLAASVHLGSQFSALCIAMITSATQSGATVKFSAASIDTAAL